MPNIELLVLVPDRWFNYGRWRRPTIAADISDHIKVERVWWPWLGPAQYYLHWYPGLQKIVRDFQPDVINLFEEPWALVSLQVCRVRDKVAPRAKIICETEQNLDKRLPPPFEQFRRAVLRRVDLVVARNAEAVGVTRRKGFKGPIEIVPNAVDAELFRPMDRAKERRWLSLQGFVVGYVGRLVEEKGLLHLLDAVALAPREVNLLLVGAGPLEANLRKKAQELNINDRVRILPQRPLEQLPEIMNAIDVLALPSRTTPRWKEQFGRVIIEAHACGTPVIGSDSGAIPDVVGEGGLIVPEGDATALSRAMTKLMRDEPLRIRMGEAGRSAATKKYTWKRVAERMYGIFQQELGRPKSHGIYPMEEPMELLYGSAGASD